MATLEQIKTVGVVGAGQMGGGIAQVAATAGYQVLLADASVEHAQKGLAAIDKSLSRLVKKEKITGDTKSEILSRIKPVGSLKDLAPSDIAVEAAPEKESIKAEIFKALDEATKPHAILASNTSSISITKIGAVTKRPEQVIGMHFMNPVPIMKLVEVIRALPTNDETYNTTKALAEKMGKTVVTSKDIPGFIVNRILIPLLNEACFALHEGLGTAEDIDTGIKLGLNHPMGPLALADLIGLDTCVSIAEVLHRELGEDKYRPCPLMRQHVAAGWLGRKTGRGFYSYEPKAKKSS